MTQTEHDRMPDPLVVEIAAALVPPALSPADHTRFDAALFARLQPRGSGWIAYLAWVPAAVAAALLVAAPMTGGSAHDWLTPLVEAQGVVTDEAGSWTTEEAQASTVRDPLATPDPAGDLAQLLPDEYSALVAWLDTAKLDLTQSPNPGAIPTEAQPL